MQIASGRHGLQKVRQRRTGMTKERRATFLDVLAVTAHVGRAARAAGVDPSSVRRLRRRDAGFALLWADAMTAGQQRLKEELLARSLGQVADDDNPGPDRHEPAGEALPPFDADEARRTLETLARLERADARGNGRPDYATDAEVTVLLTRRLDALAKRLNQA